MPTYATVDDFEKYVEGWVTDNADALERLLEKAEVDVDRLLGPRPTDPATGRKVVLADIEPWQRVKLANATCAAAEYRWRNGPEFLAKAQGSPTSVSGPDFSMSFGDSRSAARARAYAPEALNELQDSGLIFTSALGV